MNNFYGAVEIRLVGNSDPSKDYGNFCFSPLVLAQDERVGSPPSQEVAATRIRRLICDAFSED